MTTNTDSSPGVEHALSLALAASVAACERYRSALAARDDLLAIAAAADEMAAAAGRVAGLARLSATMQAAAGPVLRAC